MKVSVILTSYNHEKFIEQSIESVLNQTFQDFEFIIVDDCSTDSSWEIISRYKKQYPEIIAIRHDYNWHGGVTEDTVRNYATGKYIALHHSDDIWELDKLEKQMQTMENTPECVAVFTNAKAIDDNGQDYSDENGFYYNLFKVENRSRQEWLNYFFYKGNCLCHPSILVRKDVYMEDGFFRKGLRQIPDFVKWIQICSKHEIYVLSEPLVKFRVHEAGKNASGMRAETQIRSTVELYLMLEEYAKIQDYEEFIAVFPEATEYCKKDYFIPEYALGKICTEFGVQPYTRIFGIGLLYKALNNSEKTDILKTVYNYRMQDFMLETGKYDIFGVLPNAFEQQRSIYVDTGDGFSAENVYCQKFTLSSLEAIDWKCEIKIDDNKQVKSLRFDPAEAVMIKNSIVSATINGIEVECTPSNSLTKKDNKDIFISLDPIYIIDIPESLQNEKQLVVSIVGDIERLVDDEITNVVSEVIYEKRDTIYEYQAKLLEKEEELRVAFYAQRDLNGEVERLTREMSTEVERLTREYDVLLNAYNNQVQQNVDLTDKYLGIEKSHASLTEEHAYLLKSHVSLAEEQAYLLKSHVSLTETHADLLKSYQQLNSELDEVKQHWMYRIMKKKKS